MTIAWQTSGLIKIHATEHAKSNYGVAIIYVDKYVGKYVDLVIYPHDRMKII